MPSWLCHVLFPGTHFTFQPLCLRVLHRRLSCEAPLTLLPSPTHRPHPPWITYLSSSDTLFLKEVSVAGANWSVRIHQACGGPGWTSYTSEGSESPKTTVLMRNLGHSMLHFFLIAPTTLLEFWMSHFLPLLQIRGSKHSTYLFLMYETPNLVKRYWMAK